jgi:hypothetical protein
VGSVAGNQPRNRNGRIIAGTGAASRRNGKEELVDARSEADAKGCASRRQSLEESRPFSQSGLPEPSGAGCVGVPATS